MEKFMSRLMKYDSGLAGFFAGAIFGGLIATGGLNLFDYVKSLV